MNRTFRPFPKSNVAVTLGDMSKSQLAGTIKDLKRRLRQAETQSQALSNILIGITLRPGAFVSVDGKVMIDVAALEGVQQGTQLQILPLQTSFGSAVELKVTLPALQFPALDGAP